MEMRKSDNKLWGSATLCSRPKMHRGIALAVMFALALILLPVEAYPDGCDVRGDIPFTVSNDTIDVCFHCDGPWFRTSKYVKIKARKQNCAFYAAEKTLFSPYGDWTCCVVGLTADGNCNIEDILAEGDFCVKKSGLLPQFDIDLDDGRFFIDSNLDSPPPFCPTSVSAFLGDNPRQFKSKPDTDVFQFIGSAGDEVMLRLEADPNDGNNGGEASFGLHGDSLNEATNGNLPLEINATLPANTVYSISVEQMRNTRGLRYRGSYTVILDSQAGVDLIEPTKNVEK